MQITVFSIRFTDGAWREFLHECNGEEAEAVVDSASAKAFEEFRYSAPNYTDYLVGAGYVFNCAQVPRDKPVEGDTLIVGVQIDGKVVRHASEIEHLLTRR